MDDVINNLQRSIDEVDHEMKRGEVGYHQSLNGHWCIRGRGFTVL